MQKYWVLFKAFLQTHFVYRGRILIWVLLDVTHFGVLPFIWLYIANQGAKLASFTPADIVTYYIILAFTSMGFTSHTGKIISYHVREGKLNKHLTRPINYFGTITISEISYRIISTTFGCITVSIVALLIPAKYVTFSSSPTNVALFILSLIIVFIISHLISIILGVCSLWLVTVRGPEQINHLLSTIFSGTLAPLAFFPESIQTIANYLPYKFIADVPVSIALGKLSLPEIGIELLTAGAWMLFLILVIQFMWKRAIRQYDGVGM